MADSRSLEASRLIGPRRLPRLDRTHWVSRYLRQPMAVTGLALLVLLVCVAVFAAQISSSPPKTGSADPLLGPSGEHWMGTDDLGRDTFSNVVYGTRAALLVGLVTAATSLAIGGIVGIVSGYFGGYVDDVLMRITETFQLMPRFFLALLLITVFGSGLWLVSLVLGLTFWPGTARVLRAQVLTLRGRDFVQAARAVGAGHTRIMLRHIFPNAFAPVVVIAATQVGGAILTEAGLSFLGLGDPTLVTWGQMLNDSQRFLRIAWWLFVFPGAALMLTVLATTMIADGLNEALRPGGR